MATAQYFSIAHLIRKLAILHVFHCNNTHVSVTTDLPDVCKGDRAYCAY